MRSSQDSYRTCKVDLGGVLDCFYGFTAEAIHRPKRDGIGNSARIPPMRLLWKPGTARYRFAPVFVK